MYLDPPTAPEIRPATFKETVLVGTPADFLKALQDGTSYKSLSDRIRRNARNESLERLLQFLDEAQDRYFEINKKLHKVGEKVDCHSVDGAIRMLQIMTLSEAESLIPSDGSLSSDDRKNMKQNLQQARTQMDNWKREGKRQKA